MVFAYLNVPGHFTMFAFVVADQIQPKLYKLVELVVWYKLKMCCIRAVFFPRDVNM